MGSGRRICFVCQIISQLVILSFAQPQFVAHYCNYDYQGTYTSNSTFQRNLDNTLLTLFTTNSTFYNLSTGRDPDKVYVIALCRGDLDPNTCLTCLNNSHTRLRQLCPSEKESIGWYDNCMLRYSDRGIFNTATPWPYAYVYNSDMARDVNQFNTVVRNLLGRLQGEAARGGSVMKFATGNMSGPDSLTIYGLVQCTPDLSERQCNNCLNMTYGVIPTCCNGTVEGRVLTPSCNFRYADAPFYSGTTVDASSPPNAPPPDDESSMPPPSSSKGNDDNKIQVIVPVTVVPTTILAILVCVLLYRRNRKLNETYNGMDEISREESLQYDFDTIKVATQNFSFSNKLGQGGFGAVYKGRLPDGKVIAVKRLSRDSGQGELEFKNEVSLVAKLQHRSLVRLLGYSLKDTERLLIYEFVPNGSLDRFIFDPDKRANLDAVTRCNIIPDVARGLLYLHEDSRLRIIHRDLKASNILLDEEMHPKIADFGMARLFKKEETRGATNRIVGTYGYMAPEYAMLGQFSVKSDVFSFGVLVLEIISGQRNNFRNGENIQYLLSSAWIKWRDGRVSDVIDPKLRLSIDSTNSIMRCIHIGLQCVQENKADRPTMAQVVLMLSSATLALGVPSQPAFFSSDSVTTVLEEGNESNRSKNECAQLSVNEVTITDLSGR